MDILNELRKLGHTQPAKGPPIPVSLPGVGMIGHVEHRRGLYINSALEQHVMALLRDYERAERTARAETDGRFGAELLGIARAGTDSTDAIRTIKSLTASLTKWDDVQTAFANGKFFATAGLKTANSVTANVWNDVLQRGGSPPAWSAPTAPDGAQLTENSIGFPALPMQLDVAEDLYLMNFGLQYGNSASINLLVDVLVANQNLQDTNLTSLITTTSLPRWTGGEGVQLIYDAQNALGTSASNATFTYIDQSGNPGTTVSAALTTSGASQCLYPRQDGPMIQLAAGDYGVRQALLYWGSGPMGHAVNNTAVLYKPLLLVPTISTLLWTDSRHGMQIGGFRKVTEASGGSKPALSWFFMPSAANAGTFSWLAEFVWG